MGDDMRTLTATMLIGLVMAAGLAATAALRHLYADPTPEQYLAHIDGKGEIVPAGALASTARASPAATARP